ncbi:STAS domain-containing protein [Streptomyces sp. NPDC102395]|uniref:STAS domain-containing protein n=1 Tax=Streptomyces sp. NPDC102395 TaxID=3366168 RepID=UPI0037F16254
MPCDEAVTPTLMSRTGGKPSPEQDAEDAARAPSVVQHETSGAWVVAARGAYDMDSITPLADALETAAGKHSKVVLDASGVTFADSAFLNMLIRAHQAGPLRVVAPSRQLQRLFEVTGVDTVLEVRGTVADAALS